MPAKDTCMTIRLLPSRKKYERVTQILIFYVQQVKDTGRSLEFWTRVLGFHRIRRPSQFDFGGAWLWRDGLAIHLIEGTPVARSSLVDPLSDHISFIADEPLEEITTRLSSLGIDYKEQVIFEGGVILNQVFFHDPDRNMIEICNCDTLPIRPLDDADETASSGCSAFLLDGLPEAEQDPSVPREMSVEDTAENRQSVMLNCLCTESESAVFSSIAVDVNTQCRQAATDDADPCWRERIQQCGYRQQKTKPWLQR